MAKLTCPVCGADDHRSTPTYTAKYCRHCSAYLHFFYSSWPLPHVVKKAWYLTEMLLAGAFLWLLARIGLQPDNPQSPSS